jgi:hypothetical protein
MKTASTSSANKNGRGVGVSGGESHGAVLSSDRSEGPHNIFRPDSTLSQSDEDLDDIEESLSQSINKLQVCTLPHSF